MGFVHQQHEVAGPPQSLHEGLTEVLAERMDLASAGATAKKLLNIEDVDGELWSRSTLALAPIQKVVGSNHIERRQARKTLEEVLRIRSDDLAAVLVVDGFARCEHKEILR